MVKNKEIIGQSDDDNMIGSYPPFTAYGRKYKCTSKENDYAPRESYNAFWGVEFAFNASWERYDSMYSFE